MIDILLACYNGEKYIDTQIASIVYQTFKDWTLYIHDDGSTDNTIGIIYKWAKYDARIKIIEDDKKHLGCGKNFIHLLQYSTAEYVCFCDQDDYWFENKLFVQHQSIKEVELNIPIVVVSEAWSWKFPENNITDVLRSDHPKKLSEFLFKNGGLQGSSAIFNAKLREYLLSGFIYIWMHDHIMALVAFTFGKVIYSNTKLILYRQHSSNVTPLLPESSIGLLKTILLKNHTIPIVYEPSFRDVEEFYRIFESVVSPYNKKILQQYLSYQNMSKVKRFFHILFSEFNLGKKKKIKLMIKLLFRKNYIK